MSRCQTRSLRRSERIRLNQASSNQIHRGNEDLPSTSIATRPKTASKRKQAFPIRVQPSQVDFLKINNDSPSTLTTKISKRQYTEFDSNERKEPADTQPKATAKRMLPILVAAYSSPVETPNVNEYLRSTKILKRRQTTFLSYKRKKPADVERKKPADVQRKAEAIRKLAIPIAAHSSSVEISNVNEYLRSTKILKRRQTTFISYERKKPADVQRKVEAKQKLAVPIAFDPFQIPKFAFNIDDGDIKI